MSRAALFALLALTASCKKDAENELAPLGKSVPNSERTPEPTPPTQPAMTTPDAPPEPTMTAPPSGWALRTGPGFTINAEADATKTHVEATERDPAADVYTFHRTDKVRYEVRVIAVEGSLSRAIATLRDRISFSSTQVRNEEYLPEGIGEARGIDIQYVVSEDFPSQYARARIVAAKGTVYVVRALFPKENESVAATFIESFALTN